ncbi:ATP-dependent RNA helicase [Lujinxingia sediminis]|uniref:ATP-dependent RNA helicase n=1 Tax=Lujinxingia sediminis TaxID=2480984 RepID=A0ABY0CQ86_9DELT|nr:helicase-related protein [Lujinxingia sediminis]RVU42592.1 ATP-dependent RNA helicase [Lujinxingia sediminis]
MELPVDAIRPQFMEALRAHPRHILTAPTGSGKSTRLPLWLAEFTGKPVLVVEPRRVACRSLAGFLAGQHGEEVGASVGYRVRFEDCSSAETRVLFATTGIALRMLSEEGGERARFGAVLIDEFHERGWEVDVLSAALLRAQATGGYKGHVVLTSATVDAEAIAGRIDAMVHHASGRTYPVEVRYADDVPAPTGDGLAARVRDALAGALGSGEDDGGDALVFLPGKREIQAVEDALVGLSRALNLEIVQVHGSLPVDEIQRAFRPEAPRRRVFLATNVAETSVTLPGVTLVLDSGLARMRVHRGGRSALALVAVAEASMDQRAGRAGRVRQGRCVRLWSERYSPEPHAAPEIERIELDDVLLAAASVGLEGRAFLDAPWISMPPGFAVEQARARLRRARALDDRGHLTTLGRALATMPVSGAEGRLLIDPPAELAATLCDLVAILQRGQDLLLPDHLLRGRNEEVREARRDLFEGLHDEVSLQLAALRHGEVRRHGLRPAALREVRQIARSLREVVGVSAEQANAPLASSAELVRHALKRIPESAFVVRSRALKKRVDGRAVRGKPEPWGNGEIELLVWPFASPALKDGEKAPVDPVAGVILDTFWIGDDGTGVRGSGKMVLPCTYADLVSADVGERKIGEVRAGNHRGAPYVRARVERALAGVALSAAEEALRGPELVEAAAQAILEGRILKPAGEDVLDDLHIWEVLAGWPTLDRSWTGEDPPPAPHTFLMERLRLLGVESEQDLMLVEPEDLRPDLEAELTIHRFDLDPLREEFPRVWEHLGFRYHCQVSPMAKRVTMTPMDKKTARAADPKANLLPRFRGFKVRYKNASRVIDLRG